MKVEKIGDSEFERPQPIAPMFAPALNERIQLVTDPALKDELAHLILEVEDRGRKLFAGKGRREFEAYKESVKKFMTKIVNGSFRLEEKQGQKKDGKFVVYLTMQKVDSSLDSLGQLLLAGQQDSMRILATLDEIRGMLLDTYL